MKLFKRIIMIVLYCSRVYVFRVSILLADTVARQVMDEEGTKSEQRTSDPSTGSTLPHVCQQFPS